MPNQIDALTNFFQQLSGQRNQVLGGPAAQRLTDLFTPSGRAAVEHTKISSKQVETNIKAVETALATQKKEEKMMDDLRSLFGNMQGEEGFLGQVTGGAEALSLSANPLQAAMTGQALFQNQTNADRTFTEGKRQFGIQAGLQERQVASSEKNNALNALINFQASTGTEGTKMADLVRTLRKENSGLSKDIQKNIKDYGWDKVKKAQGISAIKIWGLMGAKNLLKDPTAYNEEDKIALMEVLEQQGIDLDEDDLEKLLKDNLAIVGSSALTIGKNERYMTDVQKQAPGAVRNAFIMDILAGEVSKAIPGTDFSNFFGNMSDNGDAPGTGIDPQGQTGLDIETFLRSGNVGGGNQSVNPENFSRLAQALTNSGPFDQFSSLPPDAMADFNKWIAEFFKNLNVEKLLFGQGKQFGTGAPSILGNNNSFTGIQNPFTGGAPGAAPIPTYGTIGG